MADAHNSQFRKFTEFDISILLKARAVDGVGVFPDWEYNFSKIVQIPIFDRKPNQFYKKTLKGLVDPSMELHLIKEFEKLPSDEPLSFPFDAIVLGMRVDVCKAESECESEVRLIAEDPLLENRSAHLIYKLNRKDIFDFLSDIQKLNDSCRKLNPSAQLSVHPCSEETEFVAQLNIILRKYCKSTQLRIVAFQIRTSDTVDAVFWIFAAVKRKNNTWSLLETKSAPQGEEFFGFGKGTSDARDVVMDEFDKKLLLALIGSWMSLALKGL